MNTPLVLTSVALLAGVAARPIENDRRGDDLREVVRRPDHDRQQAFLGRIPTFDSMNSLQLHDIHDETRVQAEGDGSGSTSPKLIGAEGLSVDPDPGLDSPYMGPQRHLANIEQELEVTPSSSAHPTESSPAASKTEKSQTTARVGEADYSPMVVPLVFASIAALVLLGLAVVGVCVTQLLRRTLLRYDVWQNVTKEKGGVSWSEKEKVETAQQEPAGNDGQVAITERQVLDGPVSRLTLDSTKSSEASIDDPELMPLPEHPPEIFASSAPAVRHPNDDRTLRLAFAAWTYDNWVTHFMMAIFGWLGVFLGRTNGHQ